MLIHNQPQIVEEMFLSLKEKKLYNIPTGTGKTYICLGLAKRILEELGKKVIISTSTNQLVREFFDVSQEHNFNFHKESVKIKIGAANYIDYKQYLFYRKSGELEEYIELESLQKFDSEIKKMDKTQIFFSFFNDVVQYKDIANEKYINEILAKKSSSEDAFPGDINITNHFYLLSKAKSLSEDFFDDYVLLVDEVHLLGEVAESVLSNEFSIFSIKLSLNKLKKEILQADDFVGKEAVKKNIMSFSATAHKLLLKYSKEEKINVIDEKSRCKEYMEKLSQTFSGNVAKTLIKQISKRKEMFGKEALIFLKEISNLRNISNSFSKDEKYVNLSYTPSRGYPLISSFNENPYGFLNRLLWDKLDCFAGVSATVSPSFDPNTNEKKYALARIGLLGQSNEICFYKKHFPKELIEIYLPERNAPEYKSVYADDFTMEDSEYHQYVIKYIYKNHRGKNSIIFCGGYKEANLLAELYLSLYSDMNVFCANKSQTSSQTIKDFKLSGGLLFATRDYGVGVTLKGELLENLFLLRLPYPITSSFKWETLKNKNMNSFMANINYEMLISLMQFLGRLQRSETDGGCIHLLDKRYYTSISTKKKIDEILCYYGRVISNEDKEKQKKKIKEDDRKKAAIVLENLL